jgi:hypothetical protein
MRNVRLVVVVVGLFIATLGAGCSQEPAPEGTATVPRAPSTTLPASTLVAAEPDTTLAAALSTVTTVESSPASVPVTTIAVVEPTTLATEIRIAPEQMNAKMQTIIDAAIAAQAEYWRQADGGPKLWDRDRLLKVMSPTYVDKVLKFFSDETLKDRTRYTASNRQQFVLRVETKGNDLAEVIFCRQELSTQYDSNGTLDFSDDTPFAPAVMVFGDIVNMEKIADRWVRFGIGNGDKLCAGSF